MLNELTAMILYPDKKLNPNQEMTALVLVTLNTEIPYTHNKGYHAVPHLLSIYSSFIVAASSHTSKIRDAQPLI